VFEVLSHFVARVAPSFKTDDPLLTSVMQWMAKMQEHATTRWRGVALSGIRCNIPRVVGGMGIDCPHPAIGKCQLCPKTVCLDHAAVASNGNVACIACLNEIMKSRPQYAGQAPQAAKLDPVVERRRCLRVLGLKDPADWDEIRAAYKELALKHHPDRQKDDVARAKATKKLTELNAAFKWLDQNREAA
jgi:hypothetical protein